MLFEKGGMEIPVLFPDVFEHSDVSIEDAVPVSAGFASVDGSLVDVWGMSVSLRLWARRDDCNIISRMCSQIED